MTDLIHHNTSGNKNLNINRANIEFWNELCGTQLAQSLGIHDASRESLKKFDDFYFGFYPYLFKHVPFSSIAGQTVLEIGLGYGTLAQRLAEVGAIYTGLDISSGPVGMVNHRLRIHSLSGKAVQGNILDAPFPDHCFDGVIAIGCLHHTGNIARSISEVYRLLRPGGWAVVMVYNAYSYRRWWNHFIPTLKYFIWDYFRLGRPPYISARERIAYDSGSSGAAPETVFTSPHHFRAMARQFSRIDITMENADREPPFRRYSRERLLVSVAHWAGLDLYCRMQKKILSRQSKLRKTGILICAVL